MSLAKRLWIAVSIIILVAILMAGVINIHSAVRYLENEIKVKNLDTATALALTISQSATDTTTVALLISSQFDLGHYHSIDYLGPDGKLLLQRVRDIRPPDVPEWFIRLFPIRPEVGVAAILVGWNQMGSIVLESDPSFAYDSLWRSTLELAEWFLFGGVLLGVLGMSYIRRILRPLDDVVEQAHALAERRYLEVKPPRVLELRQIIESMNRMAQKTKAMLDEEMAQLQKLKSEYEVDRLTGYMVREVFRRSVMVEIEREDTHEHGLLVLVRIGNLSELNREIGPLNADHLIGSLARQMRETLAAQPSVRYGRLGPSDLGLLLPGLIDGGDLLQRLHAALLGIEHGHLPLLSYGVARYAPGSHVSALLSMCDQSLTPAGEQGLVLPTLQGQRPEERSAQEWHQILETALRLQEFRLGAYPVRDRSGVCLFTEAPARIHSSVCGETLVAGAFLPWARRRGLVGQVDLAIAGQALTALAEQQELELCINLGYEVVCDEVQVDRLEQLLAQHPQQASRLYLDVGEEIAFQHIEAFRQFCRRLLLLGCKIGVEHLDHHVGHLALLHGLGLHYMKLSRVLVKDVRQEAVAQALLRGLCTVAHTMGLRVIAEDVSQREDMALLFDLGLDGVTGSAVV